jgi:hypothetical protein
MKSLLLLGSLAMAGVAPATDFRNVQWGSPIAAVRSAETAFPVFATDSLLEYDTEYAGRQMGLLYRFSAGRLRGGSYHYEAFHHCGGTFVAAARRHLCERQEVSAAFLDIVQLLSREYGAPLNDALNTLCFRDATRIERYVARKADFDRSAMCVWQRPGLTVTLNASHALDDRDDRQHPYATLQLIFNAAG